MRRTNDPGLYVLAATSSQRGRSLSPLGNVYYVAGVTTGASDVNIGIYDQPVCTVTKALSKVTNNNDDIIIILNTYNQNDVDGTSFVGYTDSNDQVITINKSGFRIIGEGFLTARPEFAIQTSGSPAVSIGSSYSKIQIANVIYNRTLISAAGTLQSQLDIQGDGIVLTNVKNIQGAYDLIGIKIKEGAKDILIEDPDAEVTANGPDDWLYIEGRWTAGQNITIDGLKGFGDSKTNAWDNGMIYSSAGVHNIRIRNFDVLYPGLSGFGRFSRSNVVGDADYGTLLGVQTLGKPFYLHSAGSFYYGANIFESDTAYFERARQHPTAGAS